MIVTTLDKVWIRAATAKLLRQGKLKRQRCEVCDAARTQYRHIDYTEPGHIRWLCERHWELENLSELQRSLLRMGLHAHYAKPFDVACRLDNPGGFDLKRFLIEEEDPQVRARRRPAAALSITRLVRRGLMERTGRGQWRLSARGISFAKKLFPDMKPRTKRQLAADISLPQAISAAMEARPGFWGRRRRRPR